MKEQTSLVEQNKLACKDSIEQTSIVEQDKTYYSLVGQDKTNQLSGTEQTSLLGQHGTKRSIKRRVQEGTGIEFPEGTVNMIESKHIWKVMNR